MSVIVKSSKNAKVELYHTTECKNVKLMKTRIEISKEKAENRGLRECKACSDENYHKGVEKDFSIYKAALNAGKADD